VILFRVRKPIHCQTKYHRTLRRLWTAARTRGDDRSGATSRLWIFAHQGPRRPLVRPADAERSPHEPPPAGTCSRHYRDDTRYGSAVWPPVTLSGTTTPYSIQTPDLLEVLPAPAFRAAAAARNSDKLSRPALVSLAARWHALDPQPAIAPGRHGEAMVDGRSVRPSNWPVLVAAFAQPAR
jgi:hypothetical protein